MAVFENSCSGNYGGGYRIRLEVTENSTSIENNTSNVTIVVKCYAINSSYGNYGYANPTRIYVDGVEKAYNNPTTDYRSQRVNTLCSWTGDISHNTDGNKSINVSASFTSVSSSLSGGSVSGTVALSYIPRASSISATSVDIGSNTTITINRASASFTHTITYSFGSLSGTIATKTSNTSISWTVPTSFYAQIPNAKSGTCTLTCTTYNGNTQIGSATTTTFIATANQSLCTPTLTGTIIDTNSTTINLTGDSSKLVKYKSTAKITATATAKNSASISSVTIGGVSGSTRTISNVEQNSFSVVATDSRGYSKTITVSATMINYVPLSCSSSFKRKSQTSDIVVLNYSGNYFNDSFGSQSNTLSVNWKYREKGSNTWIDGGTLTPTISNNKYSGSLELPVEFDYKTNYEFSLYYQDKLVSSNTGINDVTKGIGSLEVYKTATRITGDLITNGFSTINATTWTPSLANANVTYTFQRGYYYRIGKIVFVWFRLRGTINSVSEPRYAYINGLPFTCAMETAGNLFEHGNATNDDTRNVLLRVVNKQLALQKDDYNQGVAIDYWYPTGETFYIGGSAVYFTND